MVLNLKELSIINQMKKEFNSFILLIKNEDGNLELISREDLKFVGEDMKDRFNLSKKMSEESGIVGWKQFL